MSRKATVTKLDPTKEVARMSISSEHDGVQYHDKDGRRIAYVDEVVDYKPEYDFETKDANHWWFRNESTLYRDVHHEVKTFRSRSWFSKYAQAIFWTYLDKYLLRYFSRSDSL